jgi:hypothetical protein
MLTTIPCTNPLFFPDLRGLLSSEEISCSGDKSGFSEQEAKKMTAKLRRSVFNECLDHVPFLVEIPF